MKKDKKLYELFKVKDKNSLDANNPYWIKNVAHTFIPYCGAMHYVIFDLTDYCLGSAFISLQDIEIPIGISYK